MRRREKFSIGPAGEVYWMGYLKLREGDRVESFHNGKVLVAGTVERMPDTRRGLPLAEAIHHRGIKIRWDSGAVGYVVGAGVMLRPEGGPYGPS